MNTNNSFCPVSAQRVNENAVRISAFIVISIAMLSLIANHLFPMVVLVGDFALRAFTSGRFSPIRQVALAGVFLLTLDEKLVDAAPKRFAAGLGFFFSLVIVLLQLTGWPLASFGTTTLLIAFAFLEGAFGFCVGCILYNLFVRPFIK